MKMKRKNMILLLAAVAALGTSALSVGAQEPARWRVWLEAKFMRAAVTQPIPGAERTVLAAGYADGEEPLYLLPEQFNSLKVPWAGFMAAARANADAELASLKPEYIRDRKAVIEYAVLRSEQPIVARAILSPALLAMFKDTLGEKLLVAVPSRYAAFVFPRLASSYQQYTPMMIEAYRATAFPVSLEVFEVSSEGWKAVGVYEEP